MQLEGCVVVLLSSPAEFMFLSKGCCRRASSRVSTSDSDTAMKDGGRRAEHRQAVLFIRQCGYMCFH